MEKLKVFEIKTQGEETWVSAYTIIHALQVFCFMTESDLHEFEEDDEIVEIPENEWKNLTIDYEDGSTETIAEFMEKNDDAAVIASTAFYEL